MLKTKRRDMFTVNQMNRVLDAETDSEKARAFNYWMRFENERMYLGRRKELREFGRFFVKDLNTGFVSHTFVDPDEWAREILTECSASENFPRTAPVPSADEIARVRVVERTD